MNDLQESLIPWRDKDFWVRTAFDTYFALALPVFVLSLLLVGRALWNWPEQYTNDLEPGWKYGPEQDFKNYALVSTVPIKTVEVAAGAALFCAIYAVALSCMLSRRSGRPRYSWVLFFAQVLALLGLVSIRIRWWPDSLWAQIGTVYYPSLLIVVALLGCGAAVRLGSSRSGQVPS